MNVYLLAWLTSQFVFFFEEKCDYRFLKICVAIPRRGRIKTISRLTWQVMDMSESRFVGPIVVAVVVGINIRRAIVCHKISSVLCIRNVCVAALLFIERFFCAHSFAYKLQVKLAKFNHYNAIKSVHISSFGHANHNSNVVMRITANRIKSTVSVHLATTIALLLFQLNSISMRLPLIR